MLFITLLLGWVGSMALPTPLLARQQATTYDLGDDLTVRQIAPDVWMHTSTSRVDGQPVPANGLLVATEATAFLVDTAWNDDQARRLLDWAEATLHKPVTAALVTHSHEDRTGGLQTVLDRGIRVHALRLTARRAAARQAPLPDTLFDAVATIMMGTRSFEAFYPGAGHAPDNIVVWIPHAHILVGGCFIKDAGATTLGYVGDAALDQWPSALARAAERYPEAALVIPGHGAVGGLDLLHHTESLLQEAAKKQPGG